MNCIGLPWYSSITTRRLFFISALYYITTGGIRQLSGSEPLCKLNVTYFLAVFAN